MTVNQQLDQLCTAHFGTTPYVADGILHGSAESLWEQARPCVLFVMKQPNSNDLLGEDYRDYDIDTLLGNQNWEQLLARLYGIVHTTANGYPTYEQATRRASITELFSSQPFAYININKENGSGTTDTRALRAYAHRHADFIRQQIEILRPHIIVCCGTGVFDTVNAVMQPSVASSANWTKYNPVLGIRYFDTYHPGRPMSGQRLVNAYEMPLKEYCKTIKQQV